VTTGLAGLKLPKGQVVLLRAVARGEVTYSPVSYLTGRGLTAYWQVTNPVTCVTSRVTQQGNALAMGRLADVGGSFVNVPALIEAVGSSPVERDARLTEAGAEWLAAHPE
jgi:hypothetical protein